MIVWITGASSGLGYATAKAMVRAGHMVIAGARRFSDGQQEGMVTLPLDVTDEGSVKHFAQRALEIGGKVDVLVHAAAVLTLGSCEETPLKDYAQVMDTVFLGMVRMNQIVLPLMRMQRSGRIILFSSINGLFGTPFQSAYSSAKHAVEGYAECLQMEVRSFGIQVSLIEPGDHRGGSQHTRYQVPASSQASSPYVEHYATTTTVMEHNECYGRDPQKLGKRVTSLLKRRKMPFRVRIASFDQHLAVYLHDVFWHGLNGLILRCYYFNKRKAVRYRRMRRDL